MAMLTGKAIYSSLQVIGRYLGWNVGNGEAVRVGEDSIMGLLWPQLRQLYFYLLDKKYNGYPTKLFKIHYYIYLLIDFPTGYLASTF